MRTIMDWRSPTQPLLIVMACVSIGAAGPARRPLNKQIMHFEPLNLPPERLRRNEGYFGDMRPTSPFSLPITAFNTTLEMWLEPAAHLFMGQPVVQLVNADGTSESRALDPLGYYTGTVHGWPNSYAHVSIDSDGLLNAMMNDGVEAYHIEPAITHFSEPQPFEHVIYRESDYSYVKPSTTRPSCTPHEASPALSDEHELERGRGRRGTSHSAYVSGQNTCNVALWADASFIAEFDKPGSSAVVTMISRFSTAAALIKATQLVQSDSPVTVELRIDRIILSNDTLDGDAVTYLKALSLVSTERNWTNVCLAQAYVHKDFEGTLGLAWTAFPDSVGQNGGICQAAYINLNGQSVANNCGFHSSLSFSSKQPELQTALVMSHEIGHNFGSPHDPEENDNEAAPEGNYLMFPYAVSGQQSNNLKFSSASITSINAAMADRAGCFQPSTGVNRPSACGNYIRDESESCDCGGSDTSCAAWDKCCDSSCGFTNGSTCSPKDHEHGVCCQSDCQARNTSFQCAAKSECSAEAYCSADSPPKCVVGERSDYSLCEQGVTTCAKGACSMMCKQGSCTESICALWNLTRCTGDYGANACEVRCLLSSGECIAPANLGDRLINETVYGPGDLLADEMDWSVRYQAPGSSCAFNEESTTSGICTKDGACVSADNEGTALAQLYSQYGFLKGDFLSYMDDEEAGAPRYTWMIIGFVFMMFCCVGLCYIGNHPGWPDKLDYFCHHYCMCMKAEVEPWDIETARARRVGAHLHQVGSHGVKKKILPPLPKTVGSQPKN